MLFISSIAFTFSSTLENLSFYVSLIAHSNYSVQSPCILCLNDALGILNTFLIYIFFFLSYVYPLHIYNFSLKQFSYISSFPFNCYWESRLHIDIICRYFSIYLIFLFTLIFHTIYWRRQLSNIKNFYLCISDIRLNTVV